MHFFKKVSVLFFIITLSVGGVFQVAPTVSAAASAPALLKDINLGGTSARINENSGDTLSYDGLAYFEACTEDYGCEPWVSDGTESGTHILKDINPGSADSAASDFIAMGAYVYFFAETDDDEEGVLHRTDGTLVGTEELDLGVPMNSDNTSDLVVFDNHLYFVVNSASLVKSDGTEFGTSDLQAVADISIDNTLDAPNISIIAAGQSRLVFTLNDEAGSGFSKVFVLDSADTVTEMVDNGSDSIEPEGLDDEAFLAVGNQFLFSYNGSDDKELWKFDPTDGYASRVLDIRAGSDGSELQDFVAISNSLIIFKACTDDYGCEAWASDSTASGTVQLRDVRAGSDDSSPRPLVGGDGLGYFTAENGDGELLLYVTDGTVGGTTRVYTADYGSSIDGNNSILFAGALYFPLGDDGGYELYKVTDDKDDAELVKDIREGERGTDIESLLGTDGGLIFIADDGIHGTEFWVTDGTEGGTELLIDIDDSTVDSGSADNNPSVMGFNGKIYFAATDLEHGNELWVTDGTEGGTHMVKDVYDGSDSASPHLLGVINDKLVFTVNNDEGDEMWATDGTLGGTTKIDYDDTLYGPQNGIVFAGKLWFTAYTDYSRLYTTNGSTITPISDEYVYEPEGFTIVGSKMYFKGYDDSNQRNLWVTDGTQGGEHKVAQIVVGGDGAPRDFAALNGKIYFSANSEQPNNDRELWVSDGTEGGTMKLLDIMPGSDSSNPSNLVRVGNKIFFSAYTSAADEELWVTDGTAGGTMLVKDIEDGGSYPEKLVGMNGILYFTIGSGPGAHELWRSDGTESGTYVVKEDVSYVDNFEVAGSLLYFKASTEEDGDELWVSDGTEGGTVQVADIRAGGANSSPVSLTFYQDKLFFFADDGQHGSEPWLMSGLDLAVEEEEEPEEEPEPEPVPTPHSGGGSSATKTKNLTKNSAVAVGAIAHQGNAIQVSLFTRNLETGASGNDVKELQKFLNGKGFVIAVSGPGSVGNESDTFGALTKAALAKFQAANGVTPAIGYFGPVTRALIASLGTTIVTVPNLASTTPSLPVATTSDIVGTVRNLEAGMEGTDVKALQALLIAQGYSIPAGATGYFAAQTKTALAAYQVAKGIVPAVGYFGTVTRTQMKTAGLSGLWW